MSDEERCHAISEDGRAMCRFLKGHDGPHGQHVYRRPKCFRCGRFVWKNVCAYCTPEILSITEQV